MSEYVVRGASVFWLCIGVLALLAWFTQPAPALDGIRIIDIPIFPALQIVSGLGALLLRAWGRRWLIITAGLTVSLSVVWPLMHGAVPQASGWLNLMVALAFIGFFMAPSVRRVFEERHPTRSGGSPGAAASDQRDYGGSILSEIAGELSVVLVIIAVLGVITLRWWIVIAGLFGSLTAAFIGYRLAGGRANTGLVWSYWKDKDLINVAEDPIATWSAKVEGLFDLLEAQHPGDYTAALRRMNLQGLPATIQEAHLAALYNPTPETWSHLKTVMLNNPPPGQK